jgi:thiamine biosynthesis lipoprotein
MGTFFEVDLRVLPEEVDRARAWIGWSRKEIVRLERIYSRHDPTSEVSSLNRELARPDVLSRSLRLSPELEGLMFSSIEVWEATGGAFDITVGPVIDVWSEAVRLGRWPELEGLRHAKRHVGLERLLLPGEGEFSVTTSGLRIDLDGISKGAVLDRLRENLCAALPGVAALLTFGESSVIALGDPEGRFPNDEAQGGWHLEIRSRGEQHEPLPRIRLRDRALSVSSSVGSTSEIRGQRISHVIDPRTGSAVDGTIEAIVVADHAAIADGWSTALLVLGAQQNALRLAEGAGLEAFVFESAGRSGSTPGWDRLVVRTEAQKLGPH